MRSIIITEQEQKIIKAFLERGDRLMGLRMLASRLRKLDLNDVHNQLEFIESFLEKVGS